MNQDFFGARMRLTEVRPISSPRAISGFYLIESGKAMGHRPPGGEGALHDVDRTGNIVVQAAIACDAVVAPAAGRRGKSFRRGFTPFPPYHQAHEGMGRALAAKDRTKYAVAWGWIHPRWMLG